MLFTFYILNQRMELQVIFLRSLLFLMSFGCIFFDPYQSKRVVFVSMFILLLLAIFSKAIVLKFKSKLNYIIILVSLFLLIINQSIVFSLLFLFFFYLSTFFYKNTSLLIAENGVQIPGPIRSNLVAWSLLENVVFKDGLLTVDYKDNRIFQLMVKEPPSEFVAHDFNLFCKEQISLASAS